MDGFFYSYRAADVNPLVLECRSRGICHGRKNKQKQKHSHGMTRKNTEGRISIATERRKDRKSSRSICHGRTRNQNAQAEERLDLRLREGDQGAG